MGTARNQGGQFKGPGHSFSTRPPGTHCENLWKYIIKTFPLDFLPVRPVQSWSSPIREIKIHVYRKRQTSDSSWEFLRIENKQIKTVPNDSYG